MKITYGKNVYGKEEIKAVVNKLNLSTQMGQVLKYSKKKYLNYFQKNMD